MEYWRRAQASSNHDEDSQRDFDPCRACTALNSIFLLHQSPNASLGSCFQLQMPPDLHGQAWMRWSNA